MCQKSGSPICLGCSHEHLSGFRTVTRFDLQGFAVCEYQGKIQNLIHEFKENYQTFLAKSIAKSIVEIVPDSCTALVPMPSKQTSFEKRGFVPAKVLAQQVVIQLAKQKRMLVQVFDWLSYARLVQDQAALSGHDRRQNLSGAMRIKNGASKRIGQGEVWLIDDIVTTGATLFEAKRCLEAAGVNVAGFLAFAETLPKNRQKAHAKVF